MSRLRTIAFAMKERLEEIEVLSGAVVVYQRKRIASEFETRMKKVQGKCVIIRLINARNQTKTKAKPRFAGNYTVSLFMEPALTKQEAQTADEIMEAIADKLQGWWPDSIPSNGLIWCEADAITFPDDPDYEVGVLAVQAPRIQT